MSRAGLVTAGAIAAARARIAADRKRGVSTDEWIIALSQLKAG
jgi:hypothetical protein